MGASFSVASTVCILVSDGSMLFPREFLFASVADAERDDGLTDQQGLIPAPCQALLLQAAGERVLIDAGTGSSTRRFAGQDTRVETSTTFWIRSGRRSHRGSWSATGVL